MNAVLQLLDSEIGSLFARVVSSATLLMILAGVFAWLLRKRSAAQRNSVWCACIGLLLILPMLAALLPSWSIQIETNKPATVASVTPSPARAADQFSPDAAPPSPPATSIHDKGAMASADPSPHVQPPRVAPQSRPLADLEPTPETVRSPGTVPAEIDWPRSLLTLWMIGLAGCLVFFAICHALAILALRQSTHVERGDAAPQLRSLATRMGLQPNAIRLRATHRALSPMTFGLWRPVILLARGATSWNERRLRHVLIHELAHVKRHDWATQLCGQIACSLYWFHPLVWLVAGRMRRTADCAADDMVLSAGESGPEYAESLVCIAKSLRRSPVLSSAAVPMARAGTFESRLRAALSISSDRGPANRRFSLAIIATLAMLASPVALIRLGIAGDDGKKSEANQATGETNSIRFDRLPNGIVTPLGSDRFRSASHQMSICYSSDGRIIATGNDDSIDLFDAETGERLKRFAMHGDQYAYETFRHVQFIAVDKRLVCSAYPDARLLIWNVETGQPEVNVHTHERHIFDLDVSPDDTSIATAGDDATVRIWDAVSGKKLRQIQLKRSVDDVEFTADGRELYLWCRDEQRIYRFDLASAKELETIEAPDYRLTLLPGAERFVATDTSGHRTVRGLAKPYDELQLPRADDHETIIGHSTDGVRVIVVQAPRTQIDNPFDHRQQVVVPPQLQVWNLVSRRLEKVLLLEHLRDSGSIAISPGGKSAAMAGLQIERWDLETGHALPSPAGHSGSVADLAFSTDGTFLATISEEDSTLCVWEVSNGRLLQTFTQPLRNEWPNYKRNWQARTAAWLNKDSIAAAPFNNGIKLWNVGTDSARDLPIELDRESNGFLMSFVRCGDHLAVAYGDDIYLFDRANRQRTGKLSEHWGRVELVVATPDGHYLASGSLDRSVVLWDMKSRSPVHVLEGTRGTIRSLSLSSDARIVAATSNEGDWIIWNGQSGKVLHHFPKPTEHGAGTVAVSAKGDLIAAGGKDLRIYDPITAEEKARVTAIDGWIGSMEFSTDGKVLATGGWRSRPRLWDVDALLRRAEDPGN